MKIFGMVYVPLRFIKPRGILTLISIKAVAPKLTNPYRPPKLKVFGALTSMTAAGSGMQFETGMGMRIPRP